MSRVSSAVAHLLGKIVSRLLHVRWLVRLPIWLYKTGLGFVFDARLLMLEHVGRNSGLRRFVVLEIVGHPSPGTYVVVSGFGEQAQWFRNIQANPRVRVYIGGSKPARATARILSPEQAADALRTYAREHPGAWSMLKPILESTLDTTISDRQLEMPMVALDLAQHAR